jgi:hypothetical protein
MTIDCGRLDAAVRGQLRAALKDYRYGRLDREDLEEEARRRANGIRATYHAGVRAALMVSCADCRVDVDSDHAAHIGGSLYCAACATKHRRVPPPRRVA